MRGQCGPRPLGSRHGDREKGQRSFRGPRQGLGSPMPGWQVGALGSPRSGSVPTVSGTTEIKT